MMQYSFYMIYVIDFKNTYPSCSLSEGGFSVGAREKIILTVCLWLTLLICGGCGLILDKSQYAYIPGKKLNEDLQPLPVTVVVNNLEDLRGREHAEYIPLIYLPALPYANSHYDRPETDPK